MENEMVFAIKNIAFENIAKVSLEEVLMLHAM